jgi:hypothetical protein
VDNLTRTHPRLESTSQGERQTVLSVSVQHDTDVAVGTVHRTTKKGLRGPVDRSDALQTSLRRESHPTEHDQRSAGAGSGDEDARDADPTLTVLLSGLVETHPGRAVVRQDGPPNLADTCQLRKRFSRAMRIAEGVSDPDGRGVSQADDEARRAMWPAWLCARPCRARGRGGLWGAILACRRR